MATLALSALGTVVGGSFGGTVLGLSGAVIGRFVGATVGNIIDNALLAKDIVTKSEGARLTGTQLVSSTEGAVIPIILGRNRVAGNVIWGTDFTEEIVTDTVSSGGKGGPRQVNTTTQYVYRTSFAVGLCETVRGATITRAWADGNPLDLYSVTHRFYDGTQTEPDGLIEAIEGVGNTPAFKGTAYVVFDNIELTNFGNRVPQITIELVAPDASDDGLSQALRSVCLIPGAGEFSLTTTPVVITDAEGAGRTPANNVSATVPDVVISLDTLQQEVPNVGSVSLVVSWFGTDTDAALCDVRPMVEYHDTTLSVTPADWVVGNVGRAATPILPLDDLDRPIYGGTPSDKSVRDVVTEMKTRGLRVSFYPFLLMTAEGLPWRGRIEGDASVFLGTCVPANFTRVGDTVSYTGPAEWSHRRMILHYARLLSDKLTAGDIFLVGSEMVSLTNGDPDWGTGLASLIADVRTILPAGVEVSYASNWDEYDHSSLLPVWSAADFVGIDYYMPLTDWRTTSDAVYTPDAFAAGFESGEYWDYYYASDEDRENNVRTPIMDPQFRQKDIGYWRDNNVPGKRVVFTEIGCPAINNGGNQPNVFYDARSVESGVPHFSTGARNDMVQRCYLEGALQYLSASGLVDPDDVFVWAWDARPYPAFPGLAETWGDAPNYARGHWINGRISSWSFEKIVRRFTDAVGFDPDRLDFTGVSGLQNRIRGIRIGEVRSPRSVLQEVMSTFNVTAREDAGVIRFFEKGTSPFTPVDIDDMVVSDDKRALTRTRLKDTDLPDMVEVTGVDEFRDFDTMSVTSVSVTGMSNNVTSVSTPIVIDEDYAFSLANIKLNETWIGRDSIELTLPFGSHLTNTDYYSIMVPGAYFEIDRVFYQISKVTIGDRIEIEAGGFNADIYEIAQSDSVGPIVSAPVTYGASVVWFADVPLRTEDQGNPWSPRLVAYQDPWPVAVAIYDDDSSGGYILNNVQSVKSVLGVTTAPFGSGPLWVWDRGNTLTLRLFNVTETLMGASEASVLNGANTLAIEVGADVWEIIQFQNVTVNGDGTLTLDTLLRGQFGTDADMVSSVPAGARVFAYDLNAVGRLEGTTDRLGVDLSLRYGPANFSVSDARYQDAMVTPAGIAYRPYAPVQLRQENISGDITLTWIRRTRFNGDSWDSTDVPLNEEIERYEVDILNGVTVVRTIVVDAAQSVTYTSAQQHDDFGSAQDSVSWVVYQISTIYGRGAPAYA